MRIIEIKEKEFNTEGEAMCACNYKESGLYFSFFNRGRSGFLVFVNKITGEKKILCTISEIEKTNLVKDIIPPTLEWQHLYLPDENDCIPKTFVLELVKTILSHDKNKMD